MNQEVLKQNPLLILETVHAYAINDLDVDKEIRDLINNNLDLLKQIDPQKGYLELKNIMNTPNPAKYIREFKEVFFAFIPGLEKTYGFEQNNPWHIHDVFEHTMHVIENTKDNAILRVAALFHDIGKPAVYTEETKTKEDGSTYKVGHFYGHNKRSAIYFEEFAKQMHIPEEEKNLISKLIVYHDFNLSTKPKKIQEYIDDLGVENIPLLFALKRADNLAQNLEKSKDTLAKLDETERIFNEYIANLPKKEEPHPVKKTK